MCALDMLLIKATYLLILLRAYLSVGSDGHRLYQRNYYLNKLNVTITQMYVHH